MRHFRSILLILIFAFFLNGCATVKKIWPFNKSGERTVRSDRLKKKSSKELEREKIKSIHKKIKSLRKNDNVFLGVGSTERANYRTYDEMIDAATKTAVRRLSEQIKIRIIGTFEEEMKFSSKDEKVKRDISSLTKSYTDIVLMDRKTEHFQNFPEKDMYTVVVLIEKEDYYRMVQQDIQQHVNKVAEYVKQALISLRTDSFSSGIEKLIQGREYLDESLEGAPVFYDMEGLGTTELGSFIDSQLSDLVEGMTIESEEIDIFYNVNGDTDKSPIFKVKYLGYDGSLTPMKKIPIKIKFNQGNGKVLGRNHYTDANGEVMVKLSAIDASKEKTVISASIDFEKMNILDREPPATIFTMKREKTIAVSVIHKKGSNKYVSRDLSSKVSGLLLKRGFKTIEADLKTDVIRDKQIKDAAGSNAQYLIHVLVTTSSKEYDEGLFMAYASSKIEIYSLPQGDLEASIEGPASSAKHISASGAQNKALVRIKDELISKVSDNIHYFK